jgi:hypothetical protein
MNIGRKFSDIVETAIATCVDVPKYKEPIVIQDATGKVVGLLIGDGVTPVNALERIGSPTDLTSIEIALTELENSKVDKIEGKGLSSNDFTTTLKNKVDNIEAGATAWSESKSIGSKLAGYVKGTVVTAILVGHSILEAIGILEFKVDSKEPAFNKNDAFNKTFGTGTNDVARGDHKHSASDITSGELNDLRLSTNVARRNANNTFVGSDNSATTKAFRQQNANNTQYVEIDHDGNLKASKTVNALTALQEAGVNLIAKYRQLSVAIQITDINPAHLVNVYNLPPAEIAKLEDPTKWTGNRYTGEPIVNTYQVQEYDSEVTNYWYKCTADNKWIRR